MATSLPRTRPAGTGVIRAVPTVLLLVIAALAVGVSYAHVMDQGGLTALKDPAYLGWGYRALELGGLAAAGLVLARRRVGLLLAAAVALAPLVGLVVSRSVGLPNATDDIGNWTEPLQLYAVAVEVALLTCTAWALGRRAARGL